MIQQPQDPNVFKMAANRMLDEQSHSSDGQQSYARQLPTRKKPAKPIPEIAESDNDDEQE